ncbi:glycosyltransferase family 4 protein [Bacteroidota bacterium]
MHNFKKLKIINIVPGFGGTFYCGNCLRDSAFVRALKAIGHDAMTLPVYLPLSSNGKSEIDNLPVFYGAVNIYLKQNFSLLRNMPSWLENFFNSAPILKYAAKKAGSTRASGLEKMTMSMLKGSEGHQKDELQQLIDFLKFNEKPDVVHLSNALLLGMAKKIREELNIPVVCSLQDEDVWIDAMDDPFREQLWQMLGEKAKDVDAFVAVSDYFAGIMKNKMNLPDNKVHVVHIGVDHERYTHNSPNLNTPVIGYLSRINKGNGFGLLIDAFIELKTNTKFTNARLKVSGGKTGDDKRFINDQINKLKKKGFHNDIEFVQDFRQEALKEFFNGLTLMSVPVLKGEAFGRYQLEALASGIPLVQPALGAFPEIINETGGGEIYEPNIKNALADKLEFVLSNPEKLEQMSKNGRNAVVTKFNSKVLTEKMVTIYQKLLKE